MKKLIKLASLVLLCAFMYSSCEDVEEDGEVYKWLPKGSRACGAYSLSYFLTKTERYTKKHVKENAYIFYAATKYAEGECGEYEWLEGYCNPVKLTALTAAYADEAVLKLPQNPQTEAEILLTDMAADLSFTGTELSAGFESEFSDYDYCIEIIKSKPPLKNDPSPLGIHYVLTYLKNGELYSRDPGDGSEFKRSELVKKHKRRKYAFCNGGIFIKYRQ